MMGFSNLHVLTVSHGEVYVHHFWLLFLIVAWFASLIGSRGSGKS